MLLLNDFNPELSIYYNSSFILEELFLKDGQNILELYKRIKEKQEISLKVFAYCLDWLYLIEAAFVDEEGCVFLCTYTN